MSLKMEKIGISLISKGPEDDTHSLDKNINNTDVGACCFWEKLRILVK